MENQGKQQGKEPHKVLAGNNRSEVARLLSQIDAEYQSAQLGLSGLSSCGSRHDFIAEKYGNVGNAQEQLEKLVGYDSALNLVVQVFSDVPVQQIMNGLS